MMNEAQEVDAVFELLDRNDGEELKSLNYPKSIIYVVGHGCIR